MQWSSRPGQGLKVFSATAGDSPPMHQGGYSVAAAIDPAVSVQRRLPPATLNADTRAHQTQSDRLFGFGSD